MRGRRDDPGLLCAAIPERCAQIPCPSEQANAFAKTAKSVAENSESVELEQGNRELRASVGLYGATRPSPTASPGSTFGARLRGRATPIVTVEPPPMGKHAGRRRDSTPSPGLL
jgi:hypothetical protein